MTIASTISSIGNALNNVASAINNAFGINTSSSDPYNYDDQPFRPGDAATIYDQAEPSAVLRNGPLELGGWTHMSEKNVPDGYVKTLQSNNVADNNVAAKNAFYFVDKYGNAPGAVNVNITGNAKANLMIGTAGENVLKGGDGNDILVGRDGNDILDGGNGNDKITGGRGNDWVSGGAGADEFHMGGGNDTVAAGFGDEVWTGADVDTIKAGNTKFTVKNFDLDGIGQDAYDRFDFADANKKNYVSHDEVGFKIVQNDGIYGVTVVDGDDGRMTLEHKWNGLEVDVSFARGYIAVGTRAEALDIIENPLHADWIHFV